MLRAAWFLVGLAVAVALSGCPGGAELENPGQYPPPLVAAGAGGAATGGTTSGGTAPTGGSAGTMPDAGCNYSEVLQRTCTTAGCHRPPISAAGLDLTPDAALLGRVYNQPAQHRSIICDSATLSTCMPPTVTCEACAQCATNDRLVDATTPDQSWILKKVQASMPGGTTDIAIGCGYAMPPPSETYTAADKACLEAMVRAFAMSGGP